MSEGKREYEPKCEIGTKGMRIRRNIGAKIQILTLEEV